MTAERLFFFISFGIVGAVLAMVVGCTTVQTRTHEFCLVSSPILIGKQDKLSDTTAKEILEHNKTGAALCGWKPGKL